jgi:4-hydroxythreonine-4-phosphate dehydrogenase
MSKFIFTCGDINGIGPEIVVKALNKIAPRAKDNFIFVCPASVFNNALKITKPAFNFNYIEDISGVRSDSVAILNPGSSYRQKTGKPTIDSGNASFDALKMSFELLRNKNADAVITAPISKTAIYMAGKKFPGQTEMFAEWCGVRNFVMMFLSSKMNAALATIHEPVKNISRLITTKNISSKIEIIFKTLYEDLKIKLPRIAVLGLNPHAGENGLIGNEEKKIIKPLLAESKYSRYLSGPFSADAFFANRLYKNFDLVFGMYHDQALVPFKLINFGAGVNFTAGLPVVRTSPDHGTAFDIAGKGIAAESSIVNAFSYAKKIVKNRNSK